MGRQEADRDGVGACRGAINHLEGKLPPIVGAVRVRPRASGTQRDQAQPVMHRDDPVGPQAASGQVEVELAPAPGQPARRRDYPAAHGRCETVTGLLGDGLVGIGDLIIESGNTLCSQRLGQDVEEDRREHRHQVDGDDRGRLPAPVGPQRPSGRWIKPHPSLVSLIRSSMWAPALARDRLSHVAQTYFCAESLASANAPLVARQAQSEP